MQTLSSLDGIIAILHFCILFVILEEMDMGYISDSSSTDDSVPQLGSSEEDLSETEGTTDSGEGTESDREQSSGDDILPQLDGPGKSEAFKGLNQFPHSCLKFSKTIV